MLFIIWFVSLVLLQLCDDDSVFYMLFGSITLLGVGYLVYKSLHWLWYA